VTKGDKDEDADENKNLVPETGQYLYNRPPRINLHNSIANSKDHDNCLFSSLT
jgi:hypothetical protein